jgi:hypothetical protein
LLLRRLLVADSDIPTGNCVVCARRDAEYGLVCQPDRFRLMAWIGDVGRHTAELLAEDGQRGEPTAPASVDIVVRGRYGTELATTTPGDRLARLMPSAPTAGLKAGGRVTGSREAQVPIAVDRVDLLAAPRRRSSRVELDEDAVGHLSVASVLDGWVDDLRHHRGRGEALPAPSVQELTSWLLLRVDEACDDHPAIDELFEDIRRLRGALMAQLGLHDIPDYKQGIPCRCGMLTLVRHNGSEFVECTSCGLALTTDEYDDHVTGLLAAAKQRKKEAA